MDEYPYSYPPQKTDKRGQGLQIIVPVIVAILGLIGVVVTAFRTSEVAEMRGRLTAIAELGPTISVMQTAAAKAALNEQTAVAELMPTISLLQTEAARSILSGSNGTPIPGASSPSAQTGKLAGVLTDRSGNPISDISVKIRNGPETRTDARGTFVLDSVMSGDQVIEVQPPSGGGQLTQNVMIEADQTTNVNIVYDASTSRLALLSITAPVDGGILEVRLDGTEHRAMVFGRSDGLQQILGEFDVWVLIKSERDVLYWVQHPQALIDASSNTWRARILLGDPEHPPTESEQWDIIAVAASVDSDFRRVLNTPSLSELPAHLRSNPVTVVAKIVP